MRMLCRLQASLSAADVAMLCCASHCCKPDILQCRCMHHTALCVQIAPCIVAMGPQCPTAQLPILDCIAERTVRSTSCWGLLRTIAHPWLAKTLPWQRCQQMRWSQDCFVLSARFKGLKDVRLPRVYYATFTSSWCHGATQLCECAVVWVGQRQT
jgi:hypothetical protein